MAVIINDQSFDINMKKMLIRDIEGVKIPELLIESNKICIDILFKITKEELDNLVIDKEVELNGYIIPSELYIKLDKEYELYNVSLVEVYLTKIDTDYFNINIDIPSIDIIIDENIILESEEESHYSEEE